MYASHPKCQWYLLFGVFILALPIYAWMLYLVDAKPTRVHLDTTALYPYLDALAGCLLLCAIGVSIGRMPQSSSTRQFRKWMLVALSLSLSCSVLGMLLFFLGASIRETVPFLIATLCVDVLFILPQIVLCPADKLIQDLPLILIRPKYTRKETIQFACFLAVWCVLVFYILPILHLARIASVLWLVPSIIGVLWERKRRCKERMQEP